MLEKIVKKYSIINKAFTFFGSIVVKTLGLFVNVENKKILFSSGMGNFIGDSPIVIYNQMKIDPFFDDYELIWAVNDVDKYKDEYNVVKLNSLKYFLTALSSRIWITSVNIERGLRFKRENNFYINTWHGIPLKYIGSDVKGRSDYNLSNIDIFLVSGQYEIDIYQDAFKLDRSKLFEWGLPRNIELESYDVQNRIHILESLDLKAYENKKIVLFAPTWKDHEYKPLDIDKIANKLDDDTVLLLKSHPLEKIEFKNEKIVDVSPLSNIPDLLKITDVLISDYSSIMIDFSLLNKPIIAYAPDYDTYKEKRGLYVDKMALAPNVVDSVDEVIEYITNINLMKEIEKTKSYNQKFFNVSSINSVQYIIESVKEAVEK